MVTTQLCRARLGGHVRRVGGLVAAAALAAAPLLVPSPAVAHRDPTIAVRLSGISPAQPDGVVVDVLDSELSYLVLGNAAAEPVRALDPDGQPFLEVSARGVYGDLDSTYLAASPRAQASGATVRLGCCPGGTWVRLSRQSMWVWPDPRLDPVLRDDSKDDGRGLGQLKAAEPLATWEAAFSGAEGDFTARGVVERKQVGSVSTEVTAAPDELDVSIIEARPPQIRVAIDGEHTVEVLDRGDQPFLRLTGGGALGRADSADYSAHLRAARLPEEGGAGWVALAGSGPGRMTWADPRLDYSNKVPAAGTDAEGLNINSWVIPVRIDGELHEIRGHSAWTSVAPPVPEDQVEGPGFWRGDRRSYLVAGGITIGLVGAYLLARRKKEIS